MTRNRKTAVRRWISYSTLTIFVLLIRSRWWIPHLITGISSVGLLLLTVMPNFVQSPTLLGIPIDFWRGVAASALAAVVVALLQKPAIFLDAAEHQFHESAKLDFHEKGLLAAYPQRGSQEVQELYALNIEKARERIWAIGMTNQKMISDRAVQIIEAVKKHPSLDVVIAFWSPKAKLVIADQPGISISDVQTMLEKWTTVAAATERDIEERQQFVCRLINDSRKEIRGRVRVVNLATPSAFTAFVFDEQVFFFPFLCTSYSTSTPTLLGAADQGLGRAIVEHFDKVLSGDLVSLKVLEIVEDSQREAPTP